MKAVAMETTTMLQCSYIEHIWFVSFLPYFSWEQWLKWVLTKSFWDIVSRKTTLTTTPVALSLPPIFLLLHFLILQNENRQIAIRRMCRHATGDVAADAGRRIQYFHKQFLKCQILVDSVQLDLTELVFRNLFAFYDICHPLTAPSSSSSSSTTSHPVALLLFS